MFLASMWAIVGNGRLMSIDIDPKAIRPPHPRATYIKGSSTADTTVARVRELVGSATNCLTATASASCSRSTRAAT
jgi:hypothetical protein